MWSQEASWCNHRVTTRRIRNLKQCSVSLQAVSLMYERVAELLPIALRQQACVAGKGELQRSENVASAGRLAAAYANKVQSDINAKYVFGPCG